MASEFEHAEIEVDGKPVAIDLSKELAVADLSTDMDQVAAKMSYWGHVWAAAEAEKERVDTSYRAWRAEYGRQILEADPKLAEWKIKQEIEASPKFKRYKEGVALAARNTTLAKAVYESFRVKASILQSKGAMLRAELDSTGMSTKRSASVGDDERVDGVREAMAKGKAKRKAATE